MGLFGNIRNAVSIPGDSLAQPTGWIAKMLSLTQTSSGVVIHEGNALTVGDVYKCANVISETIAMMPWGMFKALRPRGREVADYHPGHFLLHDEPNERMTSYTYRIAMMFHLLIWNRHASYIERDGAGRLVALWPLRPDLFHWELRDGRMWFWATTISGATVQFWEDEILFIPGKTIDGFNSMSTIGMHREALGLAKALELFGASLFGNGSMPGGWLKHPGNISKEAALRLKESFEERHRGLDNAHRLAVLEEGMEYKPSEITPETAQFVLSRQFSRSDLAGYWRVPPHKIGDLSRSTNNNIEHQALEFLTDCIQPWLVCIQQAANRSLLLPREKGKIFNEFDTTFFMRGDLAAGTEFVKTMFQSGSYSPNDILEYWGKNPVEGGDRRYIPLNMVPVDLIDDVLVHDHAAEDGSGTQDAAAGKNGIEQTVDRIRNANRRFFRDAVGRIMNRKPAERANYAKNALFQPVLSVFECVLGKISGRIEVFAAESAENIGLFLAEIEGDDVEFATDSALNRSIRAALFVPTAEPKALPEPPAATEGSEE